MKQAERLTRINEIDKFEDWLADNDPRNYLQYSYQRKADLDELVGEDELET